MGAGLGGVGWGVRGPEGCVGRIISFILLVQLCRIGIKSEFSLHPSKLKSGVRGVEVIK